MTKGYIKASLAAALFTGVSSAAIAADAADSTAAAATATAGAAATADAASQTIIVTGQRGEYGAKKTSTATKTNTDIRNIPQALTVISEKQIEDQSIRSVAELLTFVPGATPGTGESNRDQFTIRGNNTHRRLLHRRRPRRRPIFPRFLQRRAGRGAQGPQCHDLRPRRRRRDRQPGHEARDLRRLS